MSMVINIYFFLSNVLGSFCTEDYQIGLIFKQINLEHLTPTGITILGQILLIISYEKVFFWIAFNLFQNINILPPVLKIYQNKIDG